jgi:16S rRNA G966 N2-methylase RsmD
MVLDKSMAFFDRYHSFYQTSQIGATRNRLNARYKVLIEGNQEFIKNQRILDIASHDGRWSFAALKNGANHVLGIEGRPHLVKNAVINMRKYGVPKKQYRFIPGDIFDQIIKINKNTIDTVFCFGFFYHTLHHMDLLTKIKQLNPKHLILDTNISKSPQPIIEAVMEDTRGEGAAIRKSNHRHQTVVGHPSRSALEMMLKSSGFTFSYYDWKENNRSDWSHLQDYRNGKRVTLICKDVD